MTLSTSSDHSFQPDQIPSHTNFEHPRSDPEDTYRDFAYTLNQLGLSATYQDISQLNFNLLEVPDLRYLDDPKHTLIIGKTSGGMTALVPPKLFDALSKTPNHLKINFHPKPSH